YIVVLIVLLVPCLLYAAKVNIPIETFSSITGRDSTNQILVKFDLPDNFSARSHVVSAELCLTLPVSITESRKPPRIMVMSVNETWDERITGSSFYSDTNEVDQDRYETQVINADGETCIDVKDFLYKWVEPGSVNNGLIIIPYSDKVRLQRPEARIESLGELKLKYIPVAR
ncbi:hypothetical protein JW877_07720, partial [bacterium]|nr:hypothetical protein [bacterium]